MAYFPHTKPLKRTFRWPTWLRFFHVIIEGPKGCLPVSPLPIPPWAPTHLSIRRGRTTATHYIDADMSMRTHVTAVVRACFAVLRQIRSVRRSLSRHALLTLVRALIVSKVDYCNSVLAGIPGQLQDRLQSVLNAAARLVFSARRSERITPLLRELHWLPDPERVILQLCVLAYRGAVFMEQRRRTLLQLSLDIGRRHSTSSAFCWQSHAGGTIHQTFNARWPCFPSGFDTCVEQPAVVCQECNVADGVPSRAEDCTFPVVVWQWLGDRDCTAQYNCCLPATTDCRRLCGFF